MKITQIFLNILLVAYTIWFAGRIFLVNRLLPIHDQNYVADWKEGILAARKFILNDTEVLLIIVIVCVLINLLLLFKKSK